MPKELKKIMYVEDDIDIQTIGKLALVDVGGYDIIVCKNGVEAIRDIENFKPDLVLLDVMMPEMDGMTTIKKLKENETTKDIPVVFMTAKSQSHEIVTYMELGAVDVIKKPFDPMGLPVQLNNIWAKYNASRSKR